MIQARLLSEVVDTLGARLVGEDAAFSSVAIDSRICKANTLFVAFEGEHVDGHNYLHQAASEGAVAAVVTREIQDSPLSLLVVDDAVVALQQLAALERERFVGPVIGITGSAGKTTVKGMVAAIMEGFIPTQATAGNFNNHLGMPLTLLAVSANHKALVLEMGANGLHEIAELCAIAKPTIGVVTLALEAHVEGFGSLAGVIQTKGEMYDALPSYGVAVVNLDTEYASSYQQRANCQVVTCSVEGDADWSINQLKLASGGCYEFTLSSPQGSTKISLNVMGRHNVLNALLAAATAASAGANLNDIKAGLESFKPEAGRVSPKRLACGALVIDDSYNANPSAVRSAIDLLTEFEGKRTLVLGDMGELGANAQAMHADVGSYAKSQGIESLITVGSLSRAAQQAFGGDQHFDNKDEALSFFRCLKQKLQSDETLLIKGSRSAATEVYVKALEGEM